MCVWGGVWWLGKPVDLFVPLRPQCWSSTSAKLGMEASQNHPRSKQAPHYLKRAVTRVAATSVSHQLWSHHQVRLRKRQRSDWPGRAIAANVEDLDPRKHNAEQNEITDTAVHCGQNFHLWYSDMKVSVQPAVFPKKGKWLLIQFSSAL